MTWIRCSDRMPMGEACEVRLDLPHGDEVVERFASATVETLRRAFPRPDLCPDWRTRVSWRPLDELSGDSGKLNGLGKVFGAWPGDESDEEIEALLGHDRDVADTVADMETETLRAALRRYGFHEQLSMLTEECGELIASVNRYRRGRPGAFEAMIEEMADVSILIKQMKLVYRDEIEAAEARKVARLGERLGR